MGASYPTDCHFSSKSKAEKILSLPTKYYDTVYPQNQNDVMAVYNHWTGLDWITGLFLELKVQHYNSILGLTGVVT